MRLAVISVTRASGALCGCPSVFSAIGKFRHERYREIRFPASLRLRRGCPATELEPVAQAPRFPDRFLSTKDPGLAWALCTRGAKSWRFYLL